MTNSVIESGGQSKNNNASICPTKTLTVTDPDNAVLPGTNPGTMYSIRAQTMSAKNQTSEWCEPVQHMST